MKKFWLGLLGVLSMLALLCGAAACRGGPEVSVAFEEESIVMKVGDERTLQITVTGSEKEAVLTSSDPEVVAVGGGYALIAKSVGSAQLTASVGKVQATCSVTVVEDGTIGVLSLNYEEAEILKGGKITLEASLTYNAQPVTGTEISWSENSNGAIISLAADGNRAVVTGVEFGRAKVTATTVYRSKTIVAEANIRVKDDISLEISNLTRTDGEYRLNLCPQEVEENTEFTPSVIVLKHGTQVENAEVTARLKGGAGGNVVTLAGLKIVAQNRGSAVVELVYSADGDEYVQEIYVTVSIPAVQAEDVVYLEKKAAAKEITVAGIGQVSSVKLGGIELEFAQQGETVTVTGFEESDFGEGKLEITAKNMVWQADAFVCTKAIASAEDWNAVAETISGNMLNGYYVLAQDIDYAGKPAPKFCIPTWGGTQGFAGTFDGLGHVIKNFTVSALPDASKEGGQSFFGLTSATAVIRNVGFLNATIEASASFRIGVVASYHYGKVENIFVQVTNPSEHSGALVHTAFAGATVRNCVVEQRNKRTGSFALCWTSFVGSTIENGYSVGADILYRDNGDTPEPAPQTATLKGFASFAEMKAAGLDLSAFNGELWDTSNGVPVVKGHKATVSADSAILNNNEQPVAETLEIRGATNFVYTLKETIDGITIDGNIVTIVGNAGATFTVVATHTLYSDIKTEKTFTVLDTSVPTVDLGEKDVDLSLGTLVLTVEGTASEAFVGDNKVQFTQNGTALTFTGITGTAGETADISVTTDSAIYTLSAFLVSKVIHSAEDWNAVASTISGNKLDGYYVLAEDIDYAGKPAPNFCIPQWDDTQGFAGTFDGRGHVIKNFTVSVTGEVGEGGHSFFGLTAGSAIIRNVGFLNATIDAPTSFRVGVVASFHYGTVENVFVQVTNSLAHSGALVHTVFVGATVRNCVVEQCNERAGSFALCWTSFDGSTIENGYSVGADVLYRNNGDSPATAPETDNLKGFASFAEMKNAGIDLSVFDSALWDTTNGVPVAKGHRETVSAAGAITNDNTQPVMGTLEIQGNANFVYTLKETIDGITINGKTVTVVGNFGATFTVVATHALYSDITTEKTFTVANRSTENLGTGDIDLTAGTLVCEITGTVEAVTVGGNDAQFTQAGTTLTVTGLTGTAGETFDVVITTSEKYLTLTALCVTKIIHSAEDWNTVASGITANKLDGYYVLAQDIDYAGKPAPKFCTPNWGGVEGFAGTFDGRGHVIKNFTVSVASDVAADGQSFFGLTATTAVIRNLGFVNAEIDSTANFRAGVVASFHYGKIENVFVQVTNNSAHSGGLVHTVFAGATVRNCVVEQCNERAGSFALCWTSFDVSTIEHCYSIGASALYCNGGNTPAVAPETATLKNFATADEMKAAGLDLSSWDNTIWNTESGMPVFRGANA